MFKFLQDKFICPLCHCELIWNVIHEDQSRIIDANIFCASCGKEYSVKGQVVNFLIDNKIENDLWQTGEDYFDKLFMKNPKIKEILMLTPLDELNSADMYVKADILRKKGCEKEAEELRSLAYKKAYTKEMQDAIEKQFKYLIDLLKEKNQFVVDIASGHCSLVKQILQNTDLKVVATDFSMNIIESAFSSLNKEGYGERITFVAFDARKTPFRNNSVPLQTSFMGLQNIDNPGSILSELKRVSSGTFYSVCYFCSEDDEANRADLQKSGNEYMWLKESHKNEFNKSVWSVEILNSIFAKSSPTPMGEILTGVGIDGFPVADGIFEHCIVKASI